MFKPSIAHRRIGMKRQQGVALLVVILIVAMVAIIATNISGRNQLTMRRTLNMAQYSQAYWYALSGEELAIKVLKQDFEDADGNKVHRQQYWALADVVFPVEDGQIAGKISDMRTCFNLNALSVGSTENENGQPKMTLAAKQFIGLLTSLGMDEFAAERLAHTLKDYIDEDTITSPYGAEDAEYESRNVPYRAANTLMQHRSELRAVLGFSQETYLALKPYVCAIPGDNRQLLNVNTIEVEQAHLLVGMLENKISLSDAESIINQRPADGYDNIEDFWSNSSLGSVQGEANSRSSFVLTSSHFLLTAGAKVDNAVFRMDSVLHRSGNSIEVITRQYGGQQ